MKVEKTPIEGLLIVEPKVFGDTRGFFLETFNASRYGEAGVPGPFVQDNWSRSVKNTLRGLHFQQPKGQGKLVTVMRGAVWDVAVDVRRGSLTFGKWFGMELSESNKKQLWLPAGFAHGFCVLSDEADFVYKCTELYAPECDRGILWNDPELAIDWPVTTPILSKKDEGLPRLKEAPVLPSLGASS